MEELHTIEQYPRRKEVIEPLHPSENVNSGNPRIRRFLADATSGEVVVELQQDMTGSGRERLKRHREDVAGRVTIPDKWGQEGFLVDWIDNKSFDVLLAPKGIDSAREALVAEGRREGVALASRRLRIEGRC